MATWYACFQLWTPIMHVFDEPLDKNVLDKAVFVFCICQLSSIQGSMFHLT